MAVHALLVVAWTLAVVIVLHARRFGQPTKELMVASTAVIALVANLLIAHNGDKSVSAMRADLGDAVREFSTALHDLRATQEAQQAEIAQGVEALRGDYHAYHTKNWDLYLSRHDPKSKWPTEVSITADFFVDGSNPELRVHDVTLSIDSYFDPDAPARQIKIPALKSLLCARLLITACDRYILWGATIRFEVLKRQYDLSVHYRETTAKE